MKMKQTLLSAAIIALVTATACNDAGESAPDQENKDSVMIKEENVSYSADTVNMNGFVAFDENSEAKRPVVLIIHEWWGLTEYPKMRARELAKMGYLAMAIDLYGNGKTADNPEAAGALATPFYSNPQMAKQRFDAAMARIKTYPQADTSKMAAIGYCFGGAMVLNMARLGEPLNGVVSFHGNLVGVPPSKDLLKANILVCHGEDDQFVPQSELETFKKQMDSIGADYTVKTYPNATHAFTNPQATEKGKEFNIPIAYNAAADSASWQDMKDFFDKVLK